MRNVLLAALAALIATPELAVGRLADVSIIDRDTGQVLPAHYPKGEYWVAGRPGAHYAIQIKSRDGRRLLAVTSVDGVNILTGETAGHNQRGYVFDAWQGYDIAGWRKSNSQIAAFTFTSIPKSYAARTGRPDNVGVIGVALFPERQRPPRAAQELQEEAPERRFQKPDAPRTLEPEAAGNADSSAGASADRSASDKLSRESAPAAAPAPSLGTGHGRREHSLVTQVPFERAAATPDEVIRIRYDSRDNLVALGIIPRPSPRPRGLDPFPRSPQHGYVPDP
jgi:hypothetical protein